MPDSTIVPNDLSSFWMPFTANRQFKKNPRILASADTVSYTHLTMPTILLV